MLESRGSCTEQIYQFGFLALFFQKKGGARASEGLPTHMQERISPRWWRTKDGLKGNIEETSGEEGTQSRLKVKRRKQTLKTGRLLKPFRDLLYEGRIFVGGMPFYSVYRDVTGLYVRECTLRVMRQDQSNTSRCECLPQLLLKKYPLVVPSQKTGFSNCYIAQDHTFTMPSKGPPNDTLSKTLLRAINHLTEDKRTKWPKMLIKSERNLYLSMENIIFHPQLKGSKVP